MTRLPSPFEERLSLSVPVSLKPMIQMTCSLQDDMDVMEVRDLGETEVDYMKDDQHDLISIHHQSSFEIKCFTGEAIQQLCLLLQENLRYYIRWNTHYHSVIQLGLWYQARSMM